MKFEEAQTPHIGENLPAYSAVGGAALAAGRPASTLACERVCADEEVQEICPEDDGMGLIEVA